MKLSHFNFELPENRIAQTPRSQRDDAKMMVLHKSSGKIEHRKFKDIIEYFDEGDTVVFNDTKVFPALLYGKKEDFGSTIEVILLRELQKDTRLWDVLVDPARKIRVGNKLFFGEDGILVGEIVDNTTSRGRTIRFIFDGTDEEFHAIIEKLGQVPLPDYIKREANEQDRERYQTIYSEKIGAVSAPTAGFHFSLEVLKRLELKGVNLPKLTLAIGIGGIRDILVEDLSKHKMESEPFEISEETANIVNQSLKNGKKVCGVGVSAVRALESSVSTYKTCKPQSRWTNKFIYSPYEFSIPNCMISNFQAPKSPMFMVSCAFGGYDYVMEAYKVAIKEKYNFLAYGDVLFIV